MRISILYALIFIAYLPSINGQSIVSTISGKSGILAGASNSFAGINYDNASDKFGFNYRATNQYKSPPSDTSSYPDFWGVNVGTSIKTEKSKTSFVNKGNWQGGVEFELTLFKTLSKKFIIPGKTKIETRDDGTIIEQNAANFRQSNFYLRISNGLERFNSFEIVESTPDTTRVKVNNPLQNVFSLNPGFYKLYQWQSKWVLSWAVSTNFSFIANSTRHLKETYLSLNSQTLINNENVSTILQSEKQVPYFNGDGDKEVYIVPRGDLFLRYRLGDNQPVLGFLFSYSPLFSSLVKTRNSFSFGPTFGYDNLPDQVIFAILNEINQGLDGKYKYALTFQASFPVKFK